MSKISKAWVFFSAAALGAFAGALVICIRVGYVYFTNQDGSPLSAKLVTTLMVFVLVLVVMFVVACVVGSTLYAVMFRSGIANYWTVGFVGLVVGLLAGPGTISLGGAAGVFAACVFHWRYHNANTRNGIRRQE